MVEGKQRDQWQHTAWLLCQTANVHRDDKKRKRPFEFHEFYPFKMKRKKSDVIQVPFETLKKVFIDKSMKGL